jgi:acetyltransferase-like isoleucine patch superfamily enzyme
MKSISTGQFSAKSELTRFNIANRVHFGKNIVFGPNCKEVSIGYGSFIGNDLYIDVEYINIGEYTTIHHGCILHGKKTQIGHNCWIGHYTIIDSLGGDTRIGNNVGVGAHSQLWSHMKFGDTLAGCRWNSEGRLYLDDDVWLVGHSIVGPIHAKEKSMLLTGGVAVKDMEENSIYCGSPAVNLSNKFGLQFDSPSIDERLAGFSRLLSDFTAKTDASPKCFTIVKGAFDFSDDRTQFDISTRTYLPRRTDEEYHFIRYMLYDKAKWLPIGNT